MNAEMPAAGAPTPHRFDYGRMLDDFVPGQVCPHPFELTVDGSIVGPYMAAFIDATPVWTSDVCARALGLSARPVPPHLLLNLGLSFSVHDTSQQAIAHLAYVHVRWPKPLPLGGTVRAASRIIGTQPSSGGDKGVVHVQTVLTDEVGERVLDFERKALIRGGSLAARPHVPGSTDSGAQGAAWLGRLPERDIGEHIAAHARGGGRFIPPLWGALEDLQAGQVLVHANGRTVGESEHMQLSAVCRNSHPLHWDAVYSQANSFTRQRVVYGGLVLAWTLTQTSIDLGGHVLWELGMRDGAHPAPVAAGDTLFAATKVLAVRPRADGTGEVDLRVVGVKNRRPEAILEAGQDLFAPERGKDRDARIADKVLEITRTVLVGARG